MLIRLITWGLLSVWMVHFSLVDALPIEDADSHGAVASGTDVCSHIGISIFREGGNAADAAIATTLCIGVTAPYHAGIGGGGFAIVRSPNGTYEAIDFRERAPSAAFQDMYNDNVNASLYGGLALGIPGELRGLEYLHRNYALLPWARLVHPAIRVAQRGFKVTEDFIHYMNWNVPSIDFLTQDPAWAKDFAPNGTLVQLGDTIFRHRLAQTLKAVAEEGVNAFYDGYLSHEIVDTVASHGGMITLDDLRNYTVQRREHISIDYRGYRLNGVGTPAGSPIVLSILNTVRGYKMGETDTLNEDTHFLNEAIKFGYGARTEMGDPAYVPGMLAYQSSMLSDAAGAEIRNKISASHTLNVSAYNPKLLETLETPGTSHISTIDASGLAISLTSTINTPFGSQLMVPTSGIILNNQMNDFSIPNVANIYGYRPSEVNYITPWKTPLSSMSPIIAEYPDGTVFLVAGAAGGSRIITTSVQNFWHIIDQNMTAFEALAHPRFHDQLIPERVVFEWTYDNQTVSFLRDLGSNVTWAQSTNAHASAIRRTQNGTFEAVGEPRESNSGGFAY